MGRKRPWGLGGNGARYGDSGDPDSQYLTYVDCASPLTCNRRASAGDKPPQFLENAFLKQNPFLIKSLLCSKTNRKAILLKTKTDFNKNQKIFRKPFRAQPPPVMSDICRNNQGALDFGILRIWIAETTLSSWFVSRRACGKSQDAASSFGKVAARIFQLRRETRKSSMASPTI